MKQFVWLLLLVALPAGAFTPLSSEQYLSAVSALQATDLACAGTRTTDASGNPSVTVTDCILRFAVQDGGTVMNYCYRFPSYGFLSAALNKTTLFNVAFATPYSGSWSWFQGLQSPPTGIDPRCLP